MHVLVIGGDALARQGAAHIFAETGAVTLLAGNAPPDVLRALAERGDLTWVVIIGWNIDIPPVYQTIVTGSTTRPRFMLLHGDDLEATEHLLRDAFDLEFSAIIRANASLSDIRDIITVASTGLICMSPGLALSFPEKWAIPEPGISTRGLSPEDAGVVTRSQDIIPLIAKGYSNKEIGLAIGKSEALVKWRMKNLMRALKVRSRTEIATLYHTGRAKKPHNSEGISYRFVSNCTKSNDT